jgi:hypothetical protein
MKYLTDHFTLEELTKTSVKGVENKPSETEVRNLRNLCENWLEDLRYSYNMLYGSLTPSPSPTGEGSEYQEEPIIINSGYRSEAVNKAVGGAKGSNHLTGCAVDIGCLGPEQALRYMNILLDISDGTQRDFDELIMERRKYTYWIHLAVRPEGNRRKLLFDLKN